jgi:2-keto-4-pentenoate hydratase/2-oxohepta-3-ene-1,7-dioic acid hydratase in catechol pathway
MKVNEMRAVRVEFEGRWYGGVAGEDGFRLMPTPELEPVDVIASEGWSGFSARAVRPVGFSQGRLLSPIARPGKILCVGLNYRDHIEEQGLEVPRSPILFSKASTSVIGPGDPIPLHLITDQVDYEVELAVVIGRRVRGISRGQALDVVAGYTVLNDVSARDLQFGDQQWMRGKSLDGFAPMGPAIVSADEVGDPGNLEIRAEVNGGLRQSSNTRQLVFGVPELIEFCAEAMTLEPGDVIATGTPGGVGAFMDPPTFLQAGDTVTVAVERIGELTNPVDAAPAQDEKPRVFGGRAKATTGPDGGQR